jgi:peptidoglycan/LPS O-acetylase OafA/YrhL
VEFKKKKVEIEALRALAVVVVILGHLKLLGFNAGYLGVDIFFVISGYLITGVLINNKKIDLKAFYARRVKRILPLATLVLVVTLAAVRMLLSDRSLGSIYDDIGWSGLFLMNVALLERSSDYFQLSAESSFFQHYWSLAVEEQFYLFYPLLLLVLYKFKSKYLVIASMLSVTLISLVYWLIQSSNNPASAYYSTIGRVWELGAGALVMLLLGSKSNIQDEMKLIFRRILLILFPVLLLAVRLVEPQKSYSTIMVVFITALYLAFSSQGSFKSNMPYKILGFLGGISFGLYLWHWPVYLISVNATGGELTIGMKAVVIIVTLILAVISKILLEDKIHKLELRRHIKLIYAIGILCIFSTTLLSQLPNFSSTSREILPTNNSGIEKEEVTSTLLPEDKTEQPPNSTTTEEGDSEQVEGFKKSPIASDDYFTPLTSMGQLSSFIINSSKASYRVKSLKQNLGSIREDIGYHSVAGCAGENTSCTEKMKNGKEIFILGDSHANMWFPAFSRVQAAGKYRVTSFAMPGCPPVDLRGSKIVESIGKKKLKECGVLLEKYLATIKKEKPEILILTGSINNGDGAWVDRYPAIIKRLKPMVGKIIFLGDFEYGNEFVIECYNKNYTNPGVCGHKPEDRKAMYTSRILAEEKIIKSVGVQYYNPSKLQCSEAYCPAIINGIVVYRDPYHITRTYARWIGNILIKELNLN